MLNEMIIVQTAVSAFNNAALWTPAFLWWAILSLPLFVSVYFMGNVFLRRCGWNKSNILKNVTNWNAGLVLLWVVMFGGNYAVLRDEMSLLPMLTALIIFLASLFVSSYVRTLPHWAHGWKKWLLICLLLGFVVQSGGNIWWVIVLQLCALLFGCVLGRVADGQMRPIGGSVLIILTTVSAILMQPEYFRFGQLGSLTFFHLIAILAVGIFAVMAFALFNFKPHGFIYNSAYVKLKWLGRVICVLGGALFLLTEAVPVFLGTLVAVLAMVWLSIAHAQTFEVETLGHKVFAILLMLFGVILVMPVITCLGILYWVHTPQIMFWSECKRLL